MVASLDSTECNSTFISSKNSKIFQIKPRSFRTEFTIEAIKKIPLESIVLDTDAPYCLIKPSFPAYSHVRTFFPTQNSKKKTLSPEMFTKGRNEPGMIIQVAECLSGVKNLDLLECTEAIFQNTLKLFRMK